jgi:carbonic anhydrase
MSRETSRRNFVTGGLAAAGGTLAAGALSMTASSAQAFAAAPFPKTPDEALARLLAGNKRFVQGKPEHPRRDSAQRIKTAQGQSRSRSSSRAPTQGSRLRTSSTLPGELPAVTQPIETAVRAVQGQPADQLLDAAIHENVKMTQQALGQISTFADPVQSGTLKIVGYEYQLKTGKVTPV